MRTAVLALVFLFHGLCVEARITSSSPVLNRSGEPLDVQVALDGSPILSMRLAPFGRTSLWAACYGEDRDMFNRLTTLIGQDADPLVKAIPASRKLLHTLPGVPGHFNLAKLWGSDKDGMTLEARHLDALPSFVGDWHTFSAVVLSLDDFNGLTTQQRASLAQAVYLGLNLDLVGVADVSMRKRLEGSFGRAFDVSLSDEPASIPLLEYRTGLGRVRGFGVEPATVRADSEVVRRLGRVDAQPVDDVKRWLRNNHRVDDSDDLPMGRSVWLLLAILAAGLVWARGRAGRLAGLLVAWVACGMTIDPSDTKFEGLGASRLRLPAGSGQWVDATMLTSRVVSGKSEFISTGAQGLVGISTDSSSACHIGIGERSGWLFAGGAGSQSRVSLARVLDGETRQIERKGLFSGARSLRFSRARIGRADGRQSIDMLGVHVDDAVIGFVSRD